MRALDPTALDHHRHGRRAGFSWTFARYLARALIASIAAVATGLVLLVVLFDAIEQLRRLSGQATGGIWDAIELALLHAPSTAQQLLPFTMLFAAMLTFRKFSRSNELVAARSAGISIWQLLVPVWLIALILGSVSVTVLNPVSATLFARYQSQMNAVDDDGVDRMDIASGGLWLRQSWDNRPIVIHASNVTQLRSMRLGDVTIFLLNDAGDYDGRIDAPTAELAEGYWLLDHAATAEPTGRLRQDDQLRIPTRLSAERINRSLAQPETISFWALPSYIATLRSIGLPTIGHVVHYQNLLSTPLMFAAMLLIGTVFSLRFARHGGTLVFVGLGIAAGFVFFVFANVVLAVGLSGRLPAELAAWTPAVVAILLGLGLLFQTEDG